MIKTPSHRITLTIMYRNRDVSIYHDHKDRGEHKPTSD